MLSNFRRALTVAATLSIAALAIAPIGTFAASDPGVPPPLGGTHAHTDQRVCAPAPAGTAACHARIRTDGDATAAQPASGKRPPRVRPDVLGNNGAYDPSYLQSAYSTPSASNGTGQTVAIVDAYDAPNAEIDLASYRSYFGLPACTSASGCFRKVNQTGLASPLPAASGSWAQEISLDLDMVSAICPNCNILLVEANSATYNDLGTAVNAAVKMGANVVSNSYGGSEFSSETSYDTSYYNHPGTAVTASSGDSGYGVEYPAASRYVTAVGGTTLNQATNSGTRNATETVWSGAGSGCSAYESKPTWQRDAGCGNRTVSDVSAEADPNTGVWVYDSYAYQGQSGWLIFGGTSVAAPITGAVYALAGNSASSNYLSSYPYANTNSLNDVTSGSNGACGTYLCTGEPGYDGPTGLGTPNTAAAFAFVPPAPASVTTVSPTSGSTAGGDSVTITGTSLTGASAVSFGGTAAKSFTVNSATQITAVSPAHAAGTVDVTVTTSGGTSAVSTADQFTYVGPPAPTVSGSSPTSGSTAGGDSVTITGTNLTGANAVSFGGTAAKSFTVNSATQITAVSPAHTAGTVDLTVTTSGGTSAASAADQFTFVAPPAPAVSAISPASGSTNGGTSVTITGSNLSGATAVSFGGTAATSFTVNSSTQITATAPAHAAGTVDVTVTTAGGASAVATADQYTYVKADFSLTPASQTVTLTRGGNATDSISVTAANGYSSNVSLSVTGLPQRTNASFSPNPVTPGSSSTMTVTANRKAATGTYNLTITGQGADGTTHTASVTLIIQ